MIFLLQKKALTIQQKNNLKATNHLISGFFYFNIHLVTKHVLECPSRFQLLLNYRKRGDIMGLLENILTAAIRGDKLPEFSDWVEWIHVFKSDTHCETCLKLDRCWFANDNRPKLPQHPFCHCKVKTLSIDKVINEVNANCDYSKFNPYLFDPKKEYKHQKEKMFISWGYDIEDSEWLRAEIERQGREKYVAGEYVLGKLNEKGQRISIRVEIPRKNTQDIVTFITGWMVYPSGKIKLTTPYGGK